MNKILKYLLIILLPGCAKYQVVQELNVNMYHLHNPRSNEVEVVITEDKLKVGEFYKLKDIDIITLDKKDKK